MPFSDADRAVLTQGFKLSRHFAREIRKLTHELGRLAANSYGQPIAGQTKVTFGARHESRIAVKLTAADRSTQVMHTIALKALSISLDAGQSANLLQRNLEFLKGGSDNLELGSWLWPPTRSNVIDLMAALKHSLRLPDEEGQKKLAKEEGKAERRKNEQENRKRREEEQKEIARRKDAMGITSALRKELADSRDRLVREIKTLVQLTNDRPAFNPDPPPVVDRSEEMTELWGRSMASISGVGERLVDVIDKLSSTLTVTPDSNRDADNQETDRKWETAANPGAG